MDITPRRLRKKDKTSAAHLAAALEAKGWSVWWDTRLLAGRDFRAAIKAELEEAGCIVVLWSKHSIESDFVIDEANFARVQQGVRSCQQRCRMRIHLKAKARTATW